MNAVDIGLQGIEPRRPFGGVFASKDSTRPEWTRSSESGRPVEPDPKDEWSRPDVQGVSMDSTVETLRVSNGVFVCPYL